MVSSVSGLRLAEEYSKVTGSGLRKPFLIDNLGRAESRCAGLLPSAKGALSRPALHRSGFVFLGHRPGSGSGCIDQR